MRITGGTAKGHPLIGPKSGCKGIRPTSDRVREALFNILATEIVDSNVLDLYAGTGALAIDAMSRGAKAAVFVDQSRQALELIHTNLNNCFPAPNASLLQINLSRPDSIRRLQKKLPSGLHFDLVFLDPPYEKEMAENTLRMIEKCSIVQNNGLIIVEERKGVKLPKQCGRLKLIDQRQYGETGIWMYQ